MTDAGFGRLTDPPASMLLAGVRVVDPTDGSDGVRDLGIVDGRIAEAGQVPADAPRIDGRGLVAAPGLCDLHVHLREPGDPAVETVASGSRAAARGGFTTVCAMPNTDPPIDSAEAVAALVAAAAGAACRVRPIGAATVGRAGERAADIAAIAAAGAIGVSDDGASVPSRETALAVLEQAAAAGMRLFEHAEDAGLAGSGVMRSGATAARLGLTGWPDRAEVAIVERDLELARAAGAAIHLTHLSTAGSVAAVRAAKADGVAVTADVTPHHLAMAETWIAGERTFAWEPPGPIIAARAFDASCRVNPPLATREDAAALLAGLRDGTIDAIATDHAPHPTPRKLVPFAEAAPGLIGLETALSLGLAAVEAGVLDLAVLLAALSTLPARIIGEERGLGNGAVADLVVFDPRARWRVEADRLASRSSNTPLLGMELPGVVRLTVAGGRVTYRA
jgi:dihydroorotase